MTDILKIKDPNNKYYKYALAKEMNQNACGARKLEFYPPFLEWHPLIIEYRNNKIIGEKSTNPLEYYKIFQEKVGPVKIAFTIGAGSGWHQKELMKLGIVKKWISLDLNLAKGDELIEQSESEFKEGDLNFTNLPENRYDLIFCAGVLHHIINLEHLLYQLNKSLTSSGVLILVEATTPNKWQWEKGRLELIKQSFNEKFGTKYNEISFNNVPLWIINNRRTPFESIRSSELAEIIHYYFGEKILCECHWNHFIYPFLNTIKLNGYHNNLQAHNDFVNFIIELENNKTLRNNFSPSELIGVYGKNEVNKILKTKNWDENEIKNFLGQKTEPLKIFKIFCKKK